MSSQRFDVISPRTYTSGGEEKTAWDRVGVAFESRDGDGMDVVLHSYPLPANGAVKLMIRKPKERT